MHDFGLVPQVRPRELIRVFLTPFLVVWECKARSGEERRFENIYGPAGAWAKLFARDPGYLRTELHHDLQQPSRYLTLDYWT